MPLTAPCTLVIVSVLPSTSVSLANKLAAVMTSAVSSLVLAAVSTTATGGSFTGVGGGTPENPPGETREIVSSPASKAPAVLTDRPPPVGEYSKDCRSSEVYSYISGASASTVRINRTKLLPSSGMMLVPPTLEAGLTPDDVSCKSLSRLLPSFMALIMLVSSPTRGKRAPLLPSGNILSNTVESSVTVSRERRRNLPP